MSKKILMLLAASLTLALIQPSANAAVKPGTKCTKLGQTSTSAGIKYTCVKSGKNLVWNKGVAVKKAVPVPTPTPSATATPTPTPTPTASEPPKTSDPFSVYGMDAERFKAVDEYGAKLVSTRKKDVPTLNKILETPGDLAVIRMSENAQFAFSVYEQFMPLGFIPKWIVGQNGDWVKAQLKDICPNVAAGIRPNAGAASCRLTAVWRAVDVMDDPDTRNLMLIQGGHEIFHLYQGELWGQYWAVTPDWVREGTASLAMGIILTHFEDRKSFPEYGAAQKVERSPKDRNTCGAALDKWEKNESAQGFGFNNGCEYGLGLLMNEFLIMKGHTLKDTLDVVKLIGTGVDFPTAFQQVYKISMAEYFKQLRAYLKTLNYGW